LDVNHPDHSLIGLFEVKFCSISYVAYIDDASLDFNNRVVASEYVSSMFSLLTHNNFAVGLINELLPAKMPV